MSEQLPKVVNRTTSGVRYRSGSRTQGGAEPLTQCAAVHHYLALTHPEADLLDERSPQSSAELERWSAFITGNLHPAFFPVFMPARYTTAEDEGALAR